MLERPEYQSAGLERQFAARPDISLRFGDILTLVDYSEAEVALMLFDESLFWISYYAKAESREFRTMFPSVYRAALAQTFRVLKPGAPLIIKLGAHTMAAAEDLRMAESRICQTALRVLGFVDIHTLRNGRTPVMMWARKPPPLIGKRWVSRGA